MVRLCSITNNTRSFRLVDKNCVQKLKLHFGYGTEDLLASLHWLTEVGKIPEKFLKIDYANLTDEAYTQVTAEVAEVVKTVWAEIEQTFLPKRSKYGVPVHGTGGAT